MSARLFNIRAGEKWRCLSVNILSPSTDCGRLHDGVKAKIHSCRLSFIYIYMYIYIHTWLLRFSVFFLFFSPLSLPVSIRLQASAFETASLSLSISYSLTIHVQEPYLYYIAASSFVFLRFLSRLLFPSRCSRRQKKKTTLARARYLPAPLLPSPANSLLLPRKSLQSVLRWIHSTGRRFLASLECALLTRKRDSESVYIFPD